MESHEQDVKVTTELYSIPGLGVLSPLEVADHEVLVLGEAEILHVIL